MNEIKTFTNEEFGEIRTAIDKNGNPLFCCKGVSKMEVPNMNYFPLKSRLAEA